MSKSIRVKEDTHAALAAMKRENETFDELLTRLVQERQELVSAGAGVWADSNAPEKARESREKMKEGIGSE